MSVPDFVPRPMPAIFVVAGVAGAGKSTTGRLLAARIGAPYQEGDDLHPPSNLAKLRAGRPLDDADRAPWLAAIARWIEARSAARQAGVVSCSALKRAYRERLRHANAGAVRFVLLDPVPATLTGRLAARSGHFMPATLLASQLATLERPIDEPDVLTLSGTPTPRALCDAVLAWCASR